MKRFRWCLLSIFGACLLSLLAAPWPRSRRAVPAVSEAEARGDVGLSPYTWSASPSLPVSPSTASLLPGAQLALPLNPTFLNSVRNVNFRPLGNALLAAGWRRVSSMSKANVVLVGDVNTAKLARKRSPHALINSLGIKACMWGSKATQLECQESIARRDGCELYDLAIVPKSYDLSKEQSCSRFFDDFSREHNARKVWILKSAGNYIGHGKGIRLLTPARSAGASYLYKSFQPCRERAVPTAVISEYVSDAALLRGYKFDVRTYALVASLQPQLVFYHDGFVRRASVAYSANLDSKLAHITNAKGQTKRSKQAHLLEFSDVSEHLPAGFPRNYMLTEFREQAKAITTFAFQALRPLLQPTERAFQIFALDWMVDESGRVRLLESNGFPVVSNYENRLPGLVPKIWNDAIALVLDVQARPDDLRSRGTLGVGFRYEGWELVFSELEEAQGGGAYNSCSTFMRNDTRRRGQPYFSPAPSANEAVFATPPPQIACATGGVALGSRKSCKELGWDKTVAKKTKIAMFGPHKNSSICAASKVVPLDLGIPSTPQCSKKTTWADANAFCESGGARLCTYEELRARVTSNTGCFGDWKRTWTNTKCTPRNSSDHLGHLTVGPNDSDEEPFPLKCSWNDRVSGFSRCCADVAHRCVPETSLVYDGPTPYPPMCASDESLGGSRLTCAELQWAHVSSTLWRNPVSRSICHKRASSSACAGWRWSDLRIKCQKLGARLCTAGEVKTILRVKIPPKECPESLYWSATPCDTGVVAIGGLEAGARECKSVEGTALGMCCGDNSGHFCVPNSLVTYWLSEH